MKIKKYLPNYFEGFQEIECNVTTREELLDCEICKPWIENGYTITVKSGTQENPTGTLFAIKEDFSSYDACMWNVIAINIDPEDVDVLYEWLPSFIEYKQNCFVHKYGHTSDEIREFIDNGFEWNNEHTQKRYKTGVDSCEFVDELPEPTKHSELIESCERIAESDTGLYYFVITGNESACLSKTNGNVDTLAKMLAMEFEERSEILAAVIKALAILEGVDELLHG